jgi:hypothetical protein
MREQPYLTFVRNFGDNDVSVSVNQISHDGDRLNAPDNCIFGGVLSQNQAIAAIHLTNRNF